MTNIEFTPDEKVAQFDEIAAHFYDHNFGQLSKSEFELMMFQFYIAKLRQCSRCDDGTIDYVKYSDYRIGKELGITQQRVRNLKVRAQLTQPIEYDWKKDLAKLTENARYDKVTRRITLNIPDPILYMEIQDYIESTGAYIEKQLNSKVMQLRAEYYVDLILALEPDSTQKEVRAELKKFFSQKGKSDIVLADREIGKTLIEGAVNITEIMANLSGFFSPDNILLTAFTKVIGFDL